VKSKITENHSKSKKKGGKSVRKMPKIKRENLAINAERKDKFLKNSGTQKISKHKNCRKSNKAVSFQNPCFIGRTFVPFHPSAHFCAIALQIGDCGPGGFAHFAPFWLQIVECINGQVHMAWRAFRAFVVGLDGQTARL
jgi:hypothetical protein